MSFMFCTSSYFCAYSNALETEQFNFSCRNVTGTTEPARFNEEHNQILLISYYFN